MRSALFVTGAAAAMTLAAAVPAQAAISPYCGVYLAATAAGQSSSCDAPAPSAPSGLIFRQLDFHVSAGLVTATITCGAATNSVTVPAPFTGTVTIIQPRYTTCVNTLRADSAIATAVGVSTYMIYHVG